MVESVISWHEFLKELESETLVNIFKESTTYKHDKDTILCINLIKEFEAKTGGKYLQDVSHCYDDVNFEICRRYSLMHKQSNLPTINDMVNICKASGYNTIALKINELADTSHAFNPFLVATEKAENIDEKEIELRKLLNISGFGKEYAKQRLNDMSFLDNEPEWKEKATKILEEYL